MQVEWLNIEIHPDTPPEGRSIRELFPAQAVKGMFENLNQMGMQYGIKFTANDWLSNSRQAILLGEYIHLHTPEHEDAYHEAIFKAYFTNGQDIGNQEVLSAILNQLGMNPDTLSLALTDQASAARVKENSEAAFQARVTGTPTFFIGNQRIVGAQPYPQLLAAAKRASGLAPKSTGDFPVI